MPDPEHRRPQVARAATCEDFDEDAQTTLPGSRKTARVSTQQSHQDFVPRQREKDDYRLDGRDSGYVSRAATTVSDSTTSSRRKQPDLRVETAGVRERERNPYLFSQSAAPSSSSRRQSSSQSKEPSPEKRSTRFKEDVPERAHHDQYVKHPAPKQTPRAVHPPPSPVALKTAMPKTSKDDQALPPSVRRSSSNQQPRPLSMMAPNGAYPIQYAVYPTYAHAPGPPSGYATPVTPSVAYGAIPFSYAPAPAMATPTYAAFPPLPSYFDQLPEPRSARPSRNASPVRRPSNYGEPVVRHDYAESGMVSSERRPSKESRPALTGHKSARSVEVDRTNMPPPPRPEAGLSRRPSNRRAQTYHPQEPTVRERVVLETNNYESDDEREYHVLRAVPTPSRERRESSTRPPSSYRPLAAESRDRPSPRKSVSYSAGTTLTNVATSTPHAMPRRMTVPLEEREAAVEHYQAKRNSAAASSGLTVEALRKLEQRTSSSKSETGSNFSHQSLSQDSSGRERSQTAGGTKTSISLPGGMNLTIPADYMKKDGRPLSINVGGVILSVAQEGKENEQPRDQKRIERAPSIASRASKKSAASSAVSSREARGREMPPTASRRPSQLEERGPSVRSSRQPSRAPSQNRYSRDYSSRGQSVDYSKEYDEFYAQE